MNSHDCRGMRAATENKWTDPITPLTRHIRGVPRVPFGSALDGSPKPPVALSIQMHEVAGKRTCRPQVMEDLRAIDAIWSHDPGINRCCREHAEYGRNEVDPDPSPNPSKQSGREAPGRVNAVAGN
jgi:hypothetical protein